MSHYIRPLNNTKNTDYYKRLYKDEFKKRFSFSKVAKDQEACGINKTRRTCGCWVCCGVRWKLFTHDDLDLNKPPIFIIGIK